MALTSGSFWHLKMCYVERADVKNLLRLMIAMFRQTLFLMNQCRHWQIIISRLTFFLSTDFMQSSCPKCGEGIQHPRLKWPSSLNADVNDWITHTHTTWALRQLKKRFLELTDRTFVLGKKKKTLNVSLFSTSALHALDGIKTTWKNRFNKGFLSGYTIEART
jgi:hypothetical protein